MAILFDPVAKVISLDRTVITAREIYTAWVEWAASNLNYAPALRAIGLDDLGGGLLVPAYVFLLDGWKVRPMEADHLLIIQGNLFTDDGSNPIVPTLGNHRVTVQLTVPVQAQGYQLGGVPVDVAKESSVQLAIALAAAS